MQRQHGGERVIASLPPALEYRHQDQDPDQEKQLPWHSFSKKNESGSLLRPNIILPPNIMTQPLTFQQSSVDTPLSLEFPRNKATLLLQAASNESFLVSIIFQSIAKAALDRGQLTETEHRAFQNMATDQQTLALRFDDLSRFAQEHIGRNVTLKIHDAGSLMQDLIDASVWDAAASGNLDHLTKTLEKNTNVIEVISQSPNLSTVLQTGELSKPMLQTGGGLPKPRRSIRKRTKKRLVIGLGLLFFILVILVIVFYILGYGTSTPVMLAVNSTDLALTDELQEVYREIDTYVPSFSVRVASAIPSALRTTLTEAQKEMIEQMNFVREKLMGVGKHCHNPVDLAKQIIAEKTLGLGGRCMIEGDAFRASLNGIRTASDRIFTAAYWVLSTAFGGMVGSLKLTHSAARAIGAWYYDETFTHELIQEGLSCKNHSLDDLKQIFVDFIFERNMSDKVVNEWFKTLHPKYGYIRLVTKSGVTRAAICAFLLDQGVSFSGTSGVRIEVDDSDEDDSDEDDIDIHQLPKGKEDESYDDSDSEEVKPLFPRYRSPRPHREAAPKSFMIPGSDDSSGSSDSSYSSYSDDSSDSDY